jgi:hypothetical protein
MTAIVFNPAGQAIRKSETPQALARHARLTKPKRVRLDREHRLLEITYANGDIGRAHFPTTKAMVESQAPEARLQGGAVPGALPSV